MSARRPIAELRLDVVSYGEVLTYDLEHPGSPGEDALRNALCEWLGFHGIDTTLVPAAGIIVRDTERREVVVDEYRRDEHGTVVIGADGECWTRRVAHQGEAPPLEFPPAVYTWGTLAALAGGPLPREVES